MAKQVCEVMAIAGKFTKAQSDEHLRNWSEKKFEAAQKRNHYDPSRTHLNFEITQGGSYQRLTERGQFRAVLRIFLNEGGLWIAMTNPSNGLTCIDLIKRGDSTSPMQI